MKFIFFKILSAVFWVICFFQFLTSIKYLINDHYLGTEYSLFIAAISFILFLLWWRIARWLWKQNKKHDENAKNKLLLNFKNKKNIIINEDGEVFQKKKKIHLNHSSNIDAVSLKEKMKTIRWKQRFQNLQQAFAQFERGVFIDEPNEIEVQGIIKAFEFTFELCRKTLKDYLESEGIKANTPREVIKQAFANEYIANGNVWIDMLEKRNLLSHTYQEEIAQEANSAIHLIYYKELKNCVAFFTEKNND